MMKWKSPIICWMLFLGSLFDLQASHFEASNNPKRGLAIIGDAWHPAAYLYISIVKQMEEKGIMTDIIYDYEVPFDKLDEYDIIVISRYGMNDVLNFKEGLFLTSGQKDNHWINPDQESRIEEFVKNGGNLFLHHAGHAYYSQNGPITRVAKATHKGHPPRIKIRIYPTDQMPELTEGVEPFEVVDEEYLMEIEESTTVFLKSYSEKNGIMNQGWVHKYGKGKVVILVPGHDATALEHEMVHRLISNVIDYLH